MTRSSILIPENHLSETHSKWFAVLTRFRSEKDVARRLTKKGIESYVPLNRVVRQYIRKRKTVELPLLNCYVFVRILKTDYVSVLETEHVLRFIHFSKNLLAIPDPEIILLKRVCQELNDIEIEPVNFQEGKPVEIISGNLTGIQGKLVENRGKNLLIELDHIGMGLRVEIDAKLLKPVAGWISSDEVEPAQALGKKYW